VHRLERPRSPPLQYPMAANRGILSKVVLNAVCSAQVRSTRCQIWWEVGACHGIASSKNSPKPNENDWSPLRIITRAKRLVRRRSLNPCVPPVHIESDFRAMDLHIRMKQIPCLRERIFGLHIENDSPGIALVWKVRRLALSAPPESRVLARFS